MRKSANYTQVFTPTFTYNRAEKTEEGWPALDTYLKLISTAEETCQARDCFPMQTAYYRYKSNLAVILEKHGKFFCQTFIDGSYDTEYLLLEEADKVRGFFATYGKDLTVLESDHHHELPADIEIVLHYAEAITKAHALSQKYNAEISQYDQQLRQLVVQGRELIGYNPETAYEKGIGVATHCLRTLVAMASEVCLQALQTARAYTISDENDDLRMFGLFVFALNHGREKGRHLKSRDRILQGAFREMLLQMHAFMQKHPDVVTQYSKYMQLLPNDHFALIAMLEDEGLNNKESKYIGDDIFT